MYVYMYMYIYIYIYIHIYTYIYTNIIIIIKALFNIGIGTYNGIAQLHLVAMTIWSCQNIKYKYT